MVVGPNGILTTCTYAKPTGHRHRRRPRPPLRRHRHPHRRGTRRRRHRRPTHHPTAQLGRAA